MSDRSGDQLADADTAERRHFDFEILEQSGHLRRVGQRRERCPAQSGEDAEMEAHPDGKFEPAQKIDQLARAELSSDDLRLLGSLHVRDHSMAMLNIGSLQRDKNDVRVVPLDDEIGGVCEQLVVGESDGQWSSIPARRSSAWNSSS